MSGEKMSNCQLCCCICRLAAKVACDDLWRTCCGCCDKKKTQVAPEQQTMKPEKKLEGPVFSLENLNAPGMYVHLQHGSTDSGANVEIYHDKGAATIPWGIQLLEGTRNTYTLENSKAVGKFLHAACGDKDDGTNVEIYDCDAKMTASARWRIELVPGDGTDVYTLENENAEGKFLHVAYAGASDGQNVELFHDKTIASAKWRIPSPFKVTPPPEEAKHDLAATAAVVEAPAPPPEDAPPEVTVFNLENVNAEGKYLHLYYGGTDDGTTTEIYNDKSAAGASWKMHLVDGTDDTYIIENNKADGKYLHVSHGGTGDGNKCEIYHADGGSSASAQWKIQLVPETTDTYIIENVKAGKFLHVSYAGTSDGSAVEIYHDSTGTAAKWRIPLFELGK